MRALICGGRDYDDWLTMRKLFDCFPPGTVIIHGCARGADDMASKLATEYGLEQEGYPADWRKHGKAAGPIRNQQMLDEGKPSLVIAFPGGRGTADMVTRAHEADIPTITDVTHEGADK